MVPDWHPSVWIALCSLAVSIGSLTMSLILFNRTGRDSREQRKLRYAVRRAEALIEAEAFHMKLKSLVKEMEDYIGEGSMPYSLYTKASEGLKLLRDVQTSHRNELDAIREQDLIAWNPTEKELIEFEVNHGEMQLQIHDWEQREIQIRGAFTWIKEQAAAARLSKPR